MRKTIVCLANSYKHGGRCVAGICLDNGKWIRLRSAHGDGALNPRDYTLPDGHGELRPLDVFEAELHYACPSICHPEDWVIAPMPWRLVQRPCEEAAWRRITSGVRATGPLLGGYGDRIWSATLQKQPALASLTLAHPSELWWWNRDDHGKRKARALFRRNNITHDLAVTDPRWLDQMKLLPSGIHPHRLFAPDAAHTWLTVSLSEAFAPSGDTPAHFRIVAAVITH